MAQPILVTGGAGFIGSHLVERLAKGGREIVCLDNFDPYYPDVIKRENLRGALSTGRVRLVEMDIRDREALLGVLARERVEAVVHLAARAGVRPSLVDPELYFDVNVRGTLNLLTACLKASIERVVFASSSSVYGLIEGIAGEESTPCRPLSPYGASKVAAEALCSAYAGVNGLSVAALRLFTVYGPRQRPDMAINRFTSLISCGEEVPIYGNGHSLRDYTFITDVLDGIIAALEAPLRGYHVFNVGRGKPVPLLEIVTLIEHALGKQARLRFLSEQPGESPATCADIGKARSVLGYQPIVSVAEGVSGYVRWFGETGGAPLSVC